MWIYRSAGCACGCAIRVARGRWLAGAGRGRTSPVARVWRIAEVSAVTVGAVERPMHLATRAVSTWPWLRGVVDIAIC